MGWFSKFLGGAKSSAPSPEELNRNQILNLTKNYLEVRKDEGASGRPTDYASTLEYVSPSPNFPGEWPGTPLCGCCSVPFSIDARKYGLWVAQGFSGRQSGIIVPICAVCITYLNQVEEPSGGAVRFPLPSGYDVLSQQMCTRLPLDDLMKLALVRVAFMRKRLADG